MDKLHLINSNTLEFVKNLILIKLVENTRQACIGALKRHNVSLDANVKYRIKECLESLIEKISFMFGCSGYELIALLKMIGPGTSLTIVEYNNTAYKVSVKFYYHENYNGIIMSIYSNDLKHTSCYRLTIDKNEAYSIEIL